MVHGQLELDDGVIAGRWGQRALFASIASYRTGSGASLCTGDFSYEAAKAVFCEAFDILEDGSSLATAPCDSLSMGIGFTARSIQPLTLVAAPEVAADGGCAPGTDPSQDSCGGNLPADAGG